MTSTADVGYLDGWTVAHARLRPYFSVRGTSTCRSHLSAKPPVYSATPPRTRRAVSRYQSALRLGIRACVSYSTRTMPNRFP